jgi:hypothetical protein
MPGSIASKTGTNGCAFGVARGIGRSGTTCRLGDHDG